MKQQQHDIKCNKTRKKSDSQMGFEPMTLCDNILSFGGWLNAS